jgi:hypothetical protein
VEKFLSEMEEIIIIKYPIDFATSEPGSEIENQETRIVCHGARRCELMVLPLSISVVIMVWGRNRRRRRRRTCQLSCGKRIYNKLYEK